MQTDQAETLVRLLAFAKSDSEFEFGGVGFKEIDSGSYLVAVGSCAVPSVENTGESPSASLVTVSHAKAMAQLAGYFKNDVSIKRSLKAVEGKGRSIEEMKAIIKEHSHLYIKNIVSLGSWYSQDKTMFYEAVYLTVNIKED